MGKCEISRKGRSPRELNFLRQLQVCAFPQPRRGAERGGVAGNPAPTAAPAGPQPPTLRRGRARGSGERSPPSRPPPRAPRWGPGNLPGCKTARYSRAAADARVNDRTFTFLFLLFHLLPFCFPFSFLLPFFLIFNFFLYFVCLFCFLGLFFFFFVPNLFAAWFICSRVRVISNKGYRLSSDSRTHIHTRGDSRNSPLLGDPGGQVPGRGGSSLPPVQG